MELASLGMILVVLYTMVILYIGIRSSRGGSNSGKAFFLGTGTRTFVLLFTTVASAFSTWVFMGASASTFVNGHTWIATVTLYQITLTFVCGYLGPRFWVLRKEFDFVTQADLVVKYYRSNLLRYTLGICFITGMLTATIGQFKAVGMAISTMTGGRFPFWAAALYVGVVVGIYVYFGGFHGEALIDTFQGVLFSVILWGGLLVVLMRTGGLTSMFSQVESVDRQLLLYQGPSASYNVRMAFSFCLVAIMGGFVHPGFWQRYYAAKNTHTLIKMSVWFPIMVSVGVTLSGGLVGLAANLFDFPLEANDTVFQSLLSTVFSPYWGIVIVIGIMAAGMSTIAGNMNGTAMIISYDFIRFIRKGKTEEEMKTVGRKCIIIFLLISYFLSLRTPSSVTMLIQLMAAFNMMALYPVIGIFIWKRATVPGCFSGMAGGFITICITNFIYKNPLGFVAGGWGFLVGMLLFVGVSMLTKPIPKEQRAEFMRPLRERKTRPQTNTD